MKTAAFTYETQNIGDDMQSLAAALHLSRLDALVHRDKLADVALDEPHLCIFNSWFLVGEDFRPPAASIVPIMYGFCIGRNYLVQSDWKPYFARHAPVGARDLVSLELLQKARIDAYWSGCLTTFMGRKLAPTHDERRGVLFVDVDAETEEKFIPRQISQSAERLTNFAPASAVHEPFERLAWCLHLLQRLAQSRMVVTRRLHVALPCVGLGTPVCVIPDPAIASARRRFSGYEDWLPLRFKDDDQPVAFDWTDPQPVRPPAALENVYAGLLAKLQALGVADPGLLRSVKQEREISLPNPGLGPRAGAAELVFAQVRRPCLVRSWTSAEIIVEPPALPLLDRLRYSICLRSHDGADEAVTQMGAA
jgi:hypothetical protein